MNKWCFLLIAACLFAPDTGHAALKARDDVKAEDAFNPNPAPDDLILPMPCGQSMVLKAVGVRGKGPALGSRNPFRTPGRRFRRSRLL